MPKHVPVGQMSEQANQFGSGWPLNFLQGILNLDLAQLGQTLLTCERLMLLHH
jgi:hypothetical protein